jgi:hypothetical protein
MDGVLVKGEYTFTKGTVSRDRGQDEPIKQEFRPKLMFVNPFFV